MSCFIDGLCKSYINGFRTFLISFVKIDLNILFANYF